MRPYRAQTVVSALVVLMQAKWRALFQDLNISATGQRSGETLRTVAVCPIVSGPLVMKSFQAHSVTGACAGV